MAECRRTERSERALTVFADAGKFAHGTVLQKFLFRAGGNFDEARLGRVRRQLGQPR